MHQLRRRFLVVLAISIPLVAFAAKDFVMPKAYPAKSYPARDEHPMEKVTIAADPYDTPEKASIFNNRYLEHGLLPVFIIFTNDGTSAVSLQNMRIEFTTVNPKAKIQPATQDDLYRKLSRPVSTPGQRVPLPIPLPRHAKAGIDEKGRDEIDREMFKAKAIAPGETQAGFIFFDVEGISQPLVGGHIYVTRVTNGEGEELMYFDIPMEKYLSAPPSSTHQ